MWHVSMEGCGRSKQGLSTHSLKRGQLMAWSHALVMSLVLLASPLLLLLCLLFQRLLIMVWLLLVVKLLCSRC